MDAETGNSDISVVKENSLQARSVFRWNVASSADPLSPTPSTSSGMNISGPSVSLVETEETPENKKGIPNKSEPAAEEDTQMEYSSY